MNDVKRVKHTVIIKKKALNQHPPNTITSCADHIVELPSDIGIGMSYLLTLDEHTKLMLSEVEFYQNITFESDRDSLFGAFIVLEGELTIQIASLAPITINKDNMAIFFLGDSACQCTYSATKTKIINFSIGAELMASLVKDCNNTPYKQKVNDVWQFDNCFWVMPVIPEIMSIIKQIYTSELTLSANKIYLKAKIMETLTLAYDWYHQQKPHITGLSRIDFDRITTAAKLIEQQMKNPPNLPELARMVGTNDNKLKKQFKMVFKQSVYEYLHVKRMNKAKNLLINTDYTVKQIAEELGFKHFGYFSGLFKKEHHLSPNQYIKKYRIYNTVYCFNTSTK